MSSYLLLHVVLGIALLLAAGANLLHRPAESQLRMVRSLLIAAIFGPSLITLLPSKPWPNAPAQVWAPGDVTQPAMVQLGPAPRRIPLPKLPPMLPFALLGLVMAVLLRDSI